MNPSAVNSAPPGEPGFKFGNYRLEPDGTLFHQHRTVHLPAKELAALRLLLQRAGHIVTPREMREVLWGSIHVTPDSVPRCISSLRARLESDDCIQTIYKQGYRLTSPVQRDTEASGPRLLRLAIVPFLRGPNVAEHMGSAVAEDATARLTAAQPPIYSMLARDSAFALAAKGHSAHEVGLALGADLVLTGTVNIMAMHYRLRMEMIRIEDGTQIWVEDVLVPRERAAGLQSRLVERLAFRAGVSSARLPAEDEGVGLDAHAFDTFMRGRYEWQSLERHRMQDGVRYLHQAAELDPNLTQPRVDVVRACAAQELLGYVAPRVAAEEVRRIAETLKEHEDARRRILPALGWMTFHVDRDLVAAQQMLKPAENVLADPWHTRMLAMVAASRQRFAEAAGLLKAGIESDPYSPWMNAALAWVYHLSGQRDESVRQVERCLDLAPDHTAARLFGGIILAFNGEPDRAITLTNDLARHTPYFDMAIAAHAYAVACRGDLDKAAEWLERLQWLGRERYVPRSFTAPAYVALGDLEGAMAELRVADVDRCPWFFPTLADPRMHALHELPEFQAMRNTLEEMEAAAGNAAAAEPEYSET